MNRYILRRSALITAVLAFSLALALSIIAGLGAAQEAGGNVTVNASAGGSTPAPIAGTVGPIEIETYAVEDGTFILTLNVQESTSFALSDALAGLQSEGVTKVPMKTGAIREGRQKLKLSVTTVDGAAAVTLSTPSDAVRIQSGTVGAGRSPVPFSTAALAVLAAGVGAGYYSFKKGKEQLEEDDEPEVTRLA